MKKSYLSEKSNSKSTRFELNERKLSRYERNHERTWKGTDWQSKQGMEELSCLKIGSGSITIDWQSDQISSCLWKRGRYFHSSSLMDNVLVKDFNFMWLEAYFSFLMLTIKLVRFSLFAYLEVLMQHCIRN